MSHGEAFYKWNEAEKRLDFARDRPQAGPDNGDVRVDGVVSKEQFECAVGMAESWQRLFEAKQVELAKAQAERDAAQDNAELMNAAASRYLRRAEQAETTVARLKKRVEELEERG